MPVNSQTLACRQTNTKWALSLRTEWLDVMKTENRHKILYIHLIPSDFIIYGYITNLLMWPFPTGLERTVRKPLHLYREGHGYESHQALFSQLSKLRINCDDISSLFAIAFKKAIAIFVRVWNTNDEMLLQLAKSLHSDQNRLNHW